MTTLPPDSLVLRPFLESDQAALVRFCNDSTLRDNVRDGLPDPYTVEDAAAFIRKCSGENPQATFVVEYQGEVAGCIGLVLQENVYRLSAELGYWIGKPFRGKGIATRAVELMTIYAFDQLGLIRVYAGVFDFNVASAKVLQKSGFQLEGILRQAVVKNGAICNEYRYARLKQDSSTAGQD